MHPAAEMCAPGAGCTLDFGHSISKVNNVDYYILSEESLLLLGLDQSKTDLQTACDCFTVNYNWQLLTDDLAFGDPYTCREYKSCRQHRLTSVVSIGYHKPSNKSHIRVTLRTF